MCRSLLLVLMGLLTWGELSAQFDVTAPSGRLGVGYDPDYYQPVPGSWIIKFDLLGPLDMQSRLQVGVEYMVSDQFSITLDAGYHYLMSEKYNSTSAHWLDGYRVRQGWRLYLPAAASFVELEIGMKQTWLQKYESVGFECEENVCNWFEMRNYTVNRTKFLSHLKYGRQMELSRRFTLETWFGLGVQVINSEPDFLPEGGETDFGVALDIDQDDGHQVLPSATFSLKLGYILREPS